QVVECCPEVCLKNVYSSGIERLPHEVSKKKKCNGTIFRSVQSGRSRLESGPESFLRQAIPLLTAVFYLRSRRVLDRQCDPALEAGVDAEDRGNSQGSSLFLDCTLPPPLV